MLIQLEWNLHLRAVVFLPFIRDILKSQSKEYEICIYQYEKDGGDTSMGLIDSDLSSRLTE